jgi:adenine-specific DNA-methyltransferase
VEDGLGTDFGSEQFATLRALLGALFRLDQADLDFGIYRVLNQRRDEILRFVDHELLSQVRADAASEETESEVFSHLDDFFRRYYHQGDFLSRRRYKPGVYAIPYADEEVKLHWANADQYYIKSSERLRDYTFTLPGGRRVHFQLVAASAESDNNKPQAGQERRFLLATEMPLVEQAGELWIRFQYRPDAECRNQAQLNQATQRAILSTAGFTAWTDALRQPLPTDGNAQRTVLEKHLAQYTARNSFDHFIHKDLGGFLRRELDFYIKNEVLHLDDLDRVPASALEQSLGKIKILRRIAIKLIAFLEQLEDFQKRLWLKKKFVVQAHYCVTLDRVPEELYPEVAANEAQREEWMRLFAIGDLLANRRELESPPCETTETPGCHSERSEESGDKERDRQRSTRQKLRSGCSGPAPSPPARLPQGERGVSEQPLAVEFLKANPYLVLDTKYFSSEFTNRLLSSFADLDATTDGVLIYAENFQALSLVAERYRGQIGLVFTDPPYNTGVDGLPYKDSYQHSSWLSMMDSRLTAIRELMSPSGLLFLTIDFVEVARLRLLCDQVFGEDNFLADVAWEKRYTRSNNAKRFYSLKDTVLCYRRSETLAVLREARSEKSRTNYTNPDNDPRGPWIGSSYVNPATRAQRPNLVYPIRNPVTGQMVEHPTHAWKYAPHTHRQHLVDARLYWGPKGRYEYPRLKTFLAQAKPDMVPVDVWHYQDTGTTDDGGNVLKAEFGVPVFDNPKPPSLVRRALAMVPTGQERLIVLDPFAGSGTTAEAVIAANRDDGAGRKYVLVEMGPHFDSVLLPRVKKVVYSSTWSDGKPVSRSGTSQLLKYLRLESYDDSLANLSLRRTAEQDHTLSASPALRESFMLSYLLDVESRGSMSLGNADAFRDPHRYTLQIQDADGTRCMAIDMVETFNWLLGLRVRRRSVIQGVHTIDGIASGGEQVLILWRDVDHTDNAALDRWFEAQGYLAPGMPYEVVYVNGDNTLERLRAPEHTWRVRLIEQEFLIRLWETT